LDEFNQAIPKDDLAGRDRDIAPNLERFGADWLSARCLPLTVFPEIERLIAMTMIRGIQRIDLNPNGVVCG
jgi:hypothetical protein